MINIQYIVKLLLFLLIFMLQNYLTVQQSRRILSLKPLAEYWNVSLNDALKLLTNQRILSNTTKILTPLLHQYNESFGGSYIDVKANLVFINTIDFSKEPIIRSSPILKDFENLLKFIPANYSTNQLESSFNNLSELIDRTNPGEIIMGISSFYNRIVIDLNHSDDKENEAFLNATLPFEQFIFINYLFDNYSLPLRSTSDSPSSRPHNKRILERFVVAGEGLATSYNGQLTLSCSAGFSAIDNATNQLYLITSARCFPYGANVPIFHAPWEQEQLYPLNELDYFGNVTLLQQTNVDFAFILKVNPNFKITPMMRTSVDAIKQSSIDVFNTGEFPIPEEHPICVSGFFSHVKCGLISTINTRVAIESVRQAVLRDNYYGMLKANIRHVGNAELGATVFSIEFPEDGPYEGMVILVIHGIVTRVRGQTVVIQPLSGMINFALTRHFFSRLRFIDMETFRELDPQQ